MARKAEKYCTQLAADRHRRFGLFATRMLRGNAVHNNIAVSGTMNANRRYNYRAVRALAGADRS
jgi:hypothetical protein